MVIAGNGIIPTGVVLSLKLISTGRRCHLCQRDKMPKMHKQTDNAHAIVHQSLY